MVSLLPHQLMCNMLWAGQVVGLKQQKPIREGNIPNLLQCFSHCGWKKHCANSLQSCDT